MSDKISGTIIGRYTGDRWDMGNSVTKTICYCIESPKEVLRKLVRTHIIHSYKGCTTVPIREYPANMNGLTIFPIHMNDYKGMSIIGKLSDFMQDIEMKQCEWNNFTFAGFRDTIKKLEVELDTNGHIYKSLYYPVLKDYEEIYNDVFIEG